MGREIDNSLDTNDNKYKKKYNPITTRQSMLKRGKSKTV